MYIKPCMVTSRFGNDLQVGPNQTAIRLQTAEAHTTLLQGNQG